MNEPSPRANHSASLQNGIMYIFGGWNGNNILLFGSEGFGIKKNTEKYTDFVVKIEINNNIESLNISNSAAIVFHHINQQKKLS